MSEKGGKVQRRSAGDSILGSMVNSSFSISWTTSEIYIIYIIEVSRMLLMSSHNVHALEVNGTQARMAFQKHRPSNTSRRTCSKWLLSVWIWLPTRLLSELIHLWLVKLLASVGQNLTPLRTCPWRDNHSKAANLTNSWPPLHRWGLGTLHVGARFVKSALWIALPPSKKNTYHMMQKNYTKLLFYCAAIGHLHAQNFPTRLLLHCIQGLLQTSVLWKAGDHDRPNPV